MSDPRRYPFVFFQPYSADGSPVDGVFMAVEFDHGFKLTSSMKPNVNMARVSPIELQKLGQNPGVTGALFWYFNNDPEADSDGSAADVVMTFISVVDVQVEELGESPQLEPGVQALVWRVYFSDWRDGLQFPRGGRLRLGIMNQSPPPPIATNDPTDTPPDPYQNSELMQMCFDAMNISDWATVPDDADNLAPVTNLQWHGTHAPTALADLMSKVGATFCPHMDGTAAVEIIGEGDPPQPDDADVIAWLNIPTIDRRGKYVIFSSAPTGKVSTQTIGGPASDAWQFVIQNTDDIWFDVNNTKAWSDFCDSTGMPNNTRPIDLLNQSFVQLAAGSASQADVTKIQNRVAAQLYRCIRLDPDTYPPDKMPVLNITMEADGSTSVASADAIIAQMIVPGVYQDSNDPIDLPLVMISNGSILWFSDRLVKMNDGSDSSNTGQFMELYGGDPTGDGSDADLQVRVSFELTEQQTDSDGNLIYLPLYYETGYTIDAGGNVQKMNPGDVQNAIDKADRNTTYHFMPEWTDSLVWIADGVETDHSKIDDAAKAQAQTLLADLTQPSQELHVRGFFPCDLNGIISEIQWLQKEGKTIVKVNQYYRGGSVALKALLGAEQ